MKEVPSNYENNCVQCDCMSEAFKGFLPAEATHPKGWRPIADKDIREMPSRIRQHIRSNQRRALERATAAISPSIRETALVLLDVHHASEEMNSRPPYTVPTRLRTEEVSGQDV
jgi:hypothetical protein